MDVNQTFYYDPFVQFVVCLAAHAAHQRTKQ